MASKTYTALILWKLWIWFFLFWCVFELEESVCFVYWLVRLSVLVWPMRSRSRLNELLESVLKSTDHEERFCVHCAAWRVVFLISLVYLLWSEKVAYLMFWDCATKLCQNFLLPLFIVDSILLFYVERLLQCMSSKQFSVFEVSLFFFSLFSFKPYLWVVSWHEQSLLRTGLS